MIYAHQLRGLIRTDEALAEHYLAQIQGEYPATGTHRLTLLLRRGIAIGRAAARRDQLAALFPAGEMAATKPHTTADSSLDLQATQTVALSPAGE